MLILKMMLIMIPLYILDLKNLLFRREKNIKIQQHTLYCGSNSHDLQLKTQFNLLDAFKQSFGFDVAVKSVLQRKPVNCQLNSEYALSAGTKAPLSNSFIIFRHILRLAAQKKGKAIVEY